MSNQKPVKRDEAWLAKAQGLAESLVSANEALTWGACSSIDVQLALAEFSAHLTAPDPRDACLEALRLARAALDVSTTHRPEDREKVVAARRATDAALRTLDGGQS